MNTDMAITQEMWDRARARTGMRIDAAEAHYLDVQRTRALNGQPHVEHLPSCPPACMEREITEAAERIAALTSEYFDDGMIEQAIAWSTEPCPKCGDLILVGCGRHLAKHAEVTR